MRIEVIAAFADDEQIIVQVAGIQIHQLHSGLDFNLRCRAEAAACARKQAGVIIISPAELDFFADQADARDDVKHRIERPVTTTAHCQAGRIDTEIEVQSLEFTDHEERLVHGDRGPQLNAIAIDVGVTQLHFGIKQQRGIDIPIAERLRPAGCRQQQCCRSEQAEISNAHCKVLLTEDAKYDTEVLGGCSRWFAAIMSVARDIDDQQIFNVIV
ncbi:MAG: hypothetical protein HC872_02990 [Gammaproteobacteria bacterium]|nr:hypothetical protein [Gammaproteobacteria bacterium]